MLPHSLAGNFSTMYGVLPNDGEIGYHTGATTHAVAGGYMGGMPREP